MKNRAVKLLLVIVLLSFLTCTYFADVLTSDKVFSYRDLSRYYYPLRQFAVNQIKAGIFPFWNPYIGGGHPLYAALQSVVLYPLSIVYYLFDFDAGFNFFLLLHILLGGLFFYLAMRSWGFYESSSLLSAVSFMFGGYLISVVNLTTTLTSVVWFPLVFFFLDRLLTNRKFKDTLFTSFTLVLMFLGGSPDIYYGTVCLMFLYAFIYEISQTKRMSFNDCFKGVWFTPLETIDRGKKLMMSLTGFAVLPVAISFLLLSFQTLPFLELLRVSSRIAPSYEASSFWSLHPRNVISFLLPFFYGPQNIEKDIAPVARQSWLIMPYLGIVSLALVVIAFLFSRDRRSSFFKLSFLLGLLLAFGQFSPLYKFLFRNLPGFGLIRYPVKFFYICSVSFAYLAGSGWQAYLEGVKKQDKVFLRFIKALLAVGCTFSLAFLALYIYRWEAFSLIFAYAKKVFKDDYLRYLPVLYADLLNFKRLMVFLSLGGLFMFLGAKRRFGLGVVSLAMFSLAWLDYYGASNIDVNPLTPRYLLHYITPNIRYLTQPLLRAGAGLMNEKDLFRIYISQEVDKKNEVIQGVANDEAMLKLKDRLCGNRLIEHNIYDARAYLSIDNVNYTKVMNIINTAPSPSSTELLNMLNVKYVLTLTELKDQNYKLINRGWGSYLYENTNCLPRAYLVGRYLVLRNEKDIAERLKSLAFRPQEEVILEEEPSLSKAPSSQLPAPSFSESVRIISYKANKVVLEADTSGQVFLVLADNYYPGWYADIDGRPAKIYKANFTLRAVYIANPGRHRIEFRFNPLSFRIGVAVSIFTLIIIFIILIKCRGRILFGPPKG